MTDDLDAWDAGEMTLTDLRHFVRRTFANPIRITTLLNVIDWLEDIDGMLPYKIDGKEVELEIDHNMKEFRRLMYTELTKDISEQLRATPDILTQISFRLGHRRPVRDVVKTPPDLSDELRLL